MLLEDRRVHRALGDRLGERYTYAVDLTEARYVPRGVHLLRPGGADTLAAYVVHHTATGPAEGYDGVMARSWDYHVRPRDQGGKGWATGGYALLVDSAGQVFMVARPVEHLTYNAGRRFNPITIAVCCVGNYDRGEPPAEVLQSLYVVLTVLDDEVAYLPWRAHREIRHTACPGRYLAPHVAQMRGSRYGARPAPDRPLVYP